MIAKHKVLDIEISHGTLEDIFMKFMKGINNVCIARRMVHDKIKSFAIYSASAVGFWRCISSYSQ